MSYIFGRIMFVVSDAILQFTDLAYRALNANEHVIYVYLDFSKALGTVNPSIFLAKLGLLEKRGVWLEWF